MTILDHLTSQAFIDATTVTGADGRTHDLDLCCDEHVEAIIAAVLDAVDADLSALGAAMADWSSDVATAAVAVAPDLTAGEWMWAQFGVRRARMALEGLRATSTATAQDIADDRAEHDARDRGEGR